MPRRDESGSGSTVGEHESDLLVVVASEMRDDILTHHPAQRVLQLRQLDEEIVLGVEARSDLWALVVEAQPLLNSTHSCALSEIAEENEIESQGSGEDRVSAQEVDLDLHRIAEPTRDVDVVPALLRISARRVVVDRHLVEDVPVEVWVLPGLKDVLEDAQLGLFLRLEVLGSVEDLAVTVSEDVGAVPALESEHSGFEHRREHCLHQRLAGLEILAADGDVAVGGELSKDRGVDGKVRGAVAEGDSLEKGRICVELARCDRLVVGIDGLFERFDVHVGWTRFDEDLRARTPDHHESLALVVLAETVDVLADRVQHRALRRRGLHVLPIEIAGVLALERGLHRTDFTQRIADRFDVLSAFEHSCSTRSDVGVVGKDVPGSPDDVFESCQGNEVLDQRGAILGPLSEANRSHLSQGADR